jgi:hypothetical protein
MEYLLFSLLIGVLSFISGMLGLGVAFIATPVLGLFGFDLKHVIMPWSLLLNGLTATSTAIAFALEDGGLAYRNSPHDHYDDRGAHWRVHPAVRTDKYGLVDLCWRSILSLVSHGVCPKAG